MADKFNWDDHPVAEDPKEVQISKEAAKFDWDAHPEAEDDSFMGSVMGGVKAVTDGYDSYVTSPVRSATRAVQDGKNPFSAYADQFGEDPSKAPTDKSLAQKAGVSDKTLLPEGDRIPVTGPLSALNYGVKSLTGKGLEDVERSTLAGLAFSAVADPINLIPAVAPTLRGLGKAGGMIAEGAGKVASTIAPKTTEVVKSGVAAVDGVTDFLKSAGQGIVDTVRPSIRPGYEADVALAQANGIDPKHLSASHKFGDNSFIANAKKVEANGPLGEQRLKEIEQGHQAVRGAIDNDIKKIGKGLDPLDPTSAGEALRNSYDNEVTKFFDSMDMTFDRITDKDVASGLMVNKDAMETINSKLNGIAKWAKGREVRGFTNARRQQGLQVQDAMEAIRASNGSFKQMKEVLREIGEVAFKTQKGGGDTPPDIAKFKELYHTIKDGLIDTVKADVSPEFADELVANNKSMTEFFRENEHLSVLADPKAPGEKVFQDLVLSGSSQKIRALKKIVKDPAALAQMKASFLDYIKTPDAQGNFSFLRMQNALKNDDRVMRVAKELFEPGELENFEKLVKLGVDFGAPINPSGTARATAFGAIKDSVLNGATNAGAIRYMETAADGRKAAETAKKAMSPEVERISGVVEQYKAAKEAEKQSKINQMRKLLPPVNATGRKLLETPRELPKRKITDNESETKERNPATDPRMNDQMSRDNYSEGN